MLFHNTALCDYELEMLDRAVSELGASRVDSGEAFDEGRLQVAPAVAWLPSKLQSVGAPRRARPWRAHVISAQALCARGVTVTLCEGVSQRNPCSLSISQIEMHLDAANQRPAGKRLDRIPGSQQQSGTASIGAEVH
ncbi:hypothetical protein Purlil1_3258 [Purpureocillium lilacinum]|uniref:Uncharacterized protein n=1 Tax=Purpureocillium lilacinum TaxID=33203 RepID=A0ABR0C8U0_PURLI|nr:hypothetical protein Purlil1_3258 [Purpureocillium lilacinum]